MLNLPSRPNCLLLTGDLSQDETPESYDHLVDLLAPLEIPAYWLPGNHDSLSRMQACLQSQPFRGEKGFLAGGWQILLLNSAIPGLVAGELAAELTWLEAQLKNHSEQPTLITLHHPPLPVGSAWMDAIALQNSAQFLALVDRPGQASSWLCLAIFTRNLPASVRGSSTWGLPQPVCSFNPTVKTLELILRCNLASGS